MVSGIIHKIVNSNECTIGRGPNNTVIFVTFPCANCRALHLEHSQVDDE